GRLGTHGGVECDCVRCLFRLPTSTDQLDRMDCFDVRLSFIFVGYSGTLTTLALVFLVLLTLHIFVLLRDSRRICMSEKTRNYHKLMTRVLVMQV
ncbi:hypothetical protein PFISCL1PPCAC_28709, partial [Pristionchus fissidentatus]